jgi:hypothetical protein
MRLLDQPEAVPILHLGIMRELHYWLLAGEHGAILRSFPNQRPVCIGDSGSATCCKPRVNLAACSVPRKPMFGGFFVQRMQKPAPGKQWKP